MTNIINRFKNSGMVHQGTQWFWFKTNKNSLFSLKDFLSFRNLNVHISFFDWQYLRNRFVHVCVSVISLSKVWTIEFRTVWTIAVLSSLHELHSRQIHNKMKWPFFHIAGDNIKEIQTLKSQTLKCKEDKKYQQRRRVSFGTMLVKRRSSNLPGTSFHIPMHQKKPMQQFKTIK